MTDLPIPTEKDWRSEPWCLDAEHAYKNFSGKTHAEALALFEEHCIGRQEDVMFMPDACFPFYFNAYMDYLLSPNAEGDSDGASCFFSLVVFKRPELKRHDQWLIDKTVATVSYIGKNQLHFDADNDIYGSFQDKAGEILDHLAPN